MDQINKNHLLELKEQIDDTIKKIKIEERKSKLSELEKKTSDQAFWADNLKAKQVMREIQSIKRLIEKAEKLFNEINSLIEFYDSGEIENDFIQVEFGKIESEYKNLSKYLFLSGKYDNKNAIITIFAGQGGVEAHDWAEMLMRMYLRYFECKEWSYSVENIERGTEAGISSTTIIVEGEYAYGLLKNEAGTHRLVRLSPFNAQNLRQTSFAGVEVIPMIEQIDDSEFVIPETDLEFKAVRASGPGGQMVNKTSSAVQIKHIPSGISVHCSERRSQAQNRESAMLILKAKLLKIESDKKEAEIQKIKGENKSASWGNQIRNYVLQPYKLVKDLRTGIESSDPNSVLDGDIDEFIEAGLKLNTDLGILD